MIYVDTNILISAFVADSNQNAALDWLGSQEIPLGVSHWVEAEFIGHLALKYRKGELTLRQHSRALGEFDETLHSFERLAVNEASVERAARWLRDPACAMQPGDALHLACALEHGAAAIVTFDQRFAANVARMKLKGLKVIALPDSADARRAPKVEMSRALYQITPRDIANAVKLARVREVEEKAAKLRLKKHLR